MLAVEPLIVPLVQRPGFGITLSLSANMGQRGADQVLAALADGVRDEAALHRMKAHLFEHGIEHGDEIAQRVDKRSIEVNDESPW